MNCFINGMTSSGKRMTLSCRLWSEMREPLGSGRRLLVQLRVEPREGLWSVAPGVGQPTQMLVIASFRSDGDSVTFLLKCFLNWRPVFCCGEVLEHILLQLISMIKQK